MQSNKQLILFVTVFVAVFAFLVTTAPVLAAEKAKALYNFNNAGGGGYYPVAGLIFDKAGNLYGTASFANGSGCGIGCGNVFELMPNGDGTWTQKVLYTFCSLSSCADGENPVAGVIFDTAGNLYGTTAGGGTGTGCGSSGIEPCGTVFELMPNNDGTWSEKVLYSFNNNGKDAYGPEAGLVFDAKGNLYGTTPFGGNYGCTYYMGCGTVFELSPSAGGTWTETVIHRFRFRSKGGLSGLYPYGGVILDANGNLYGATDRGGAYDQGVVYELSHRAGDAWTEKVLHSFGEGKDGLGSAASLIFDAAGNLYGTTVSGGAYGGGVVFQLILATKGHWKEKVLHSFSNNKKDGYSLFAGLILDAAGNLYGTTASGGLYGGGVVFRLTPARTGRWKETELLNLYFLGKYGAYSLAGLTLDSAGNVYGTASQGGTYGWGTVFEVTP